MKAAYLFGLSFAAATLTLPSAVLAQEQRTQARVKVKDLDLTTTAGRQTADNRLKASTRAQCDDDGSRDVRSQAAAAACRKELLGKGRQKIDVATDATYIQRENEARRLAEVSIHPRRVPRHTVTVYHSQTRMIGRAPVRHKVVVHHAPVKHRVVRHRVVHRKTVVHKTTN